MIPDPSEIRLRLGLAAICLGGVAVALGVVVVQDRPIWTGIEPLAFGGVLGTVMLIDGLRKRARRRRMLAERLSDDRDA